MRLLHIWAGLTLASAAAIAQTPPASNAEYKVIYTGRMFGYFRVPEVQEANDAHCLDPQETDPTTEADEFWKEVSLSEVRYLETYFTGPPPSAARARQRKGASKPRK